MPDTLQFLRGGNVDSANRSTGERAAADRHFQLVRQLHVIGEKPVTSQQTVILLARHGSADEALGRFAHCSMSRGSATSSESAFR